MNTLLFDMTGGPDPDGIRQTGSIIRQGGLVAFPTETVYGLGGDALRADASEKIYAAKGRPSDNPLIVHIADMAHLPAIVSDIPDSARILAEHFWPGPLTMILHKSDRVPKATTGGLETVAVRMPNHPVALALIRSGGGYIAAPSANASGRPSPTRADHVMEDLNGRIDAVIDGGSVAIGLESTIVDLTEDHPVILRPGFISREMLEQALGTNVGIDPGIAGISADARPKAPGMKYRHYAPKADLAVVEGDREKVIALIREKTVSNLQAGIKTGIITCLEDAGDYTGGEVRTLGSLRDEQQIAAGLFAVLREFDQLDVAQIYSEAFDTPQLGQAIMNRLLKAAGGKVIHV